MDLLKEVAQHIRSFDCIEEFYDTDFVVGLAKELIGGKAKNFCASVMEEYRRTKDEHTVEFLSLKSMEGQFYLLSKGEALREFINTLEFSDAFSAADLVDEVSLLLGGVASFKEISNTWNMLVDKKRTLSDFEKKVAICLTLSNLAYGLFKAEDSIKHLFSGKSLGEITVRDVREVYDRKLFKRGSISNLADYAYCVFSEDDEIADSELVKNAFHEVVAGRVTYVYNKDVMEEITYQFTKLTTNVLSGSGASKVLEVCSYVISERNKEYSKKHKRLASVVKSVILKQRSITGSSLD